MMDTKRSSWAIEMRSWISRPEGMLIGTAWHKVEPERYEGEAFRLLLFRTRRQAREWCAAKTVQCRAHSPDWRFRPVRVRMIRCGSVNPRWSYSTHRATLERDGKPFAIVTPDGRNHLSEEDQKTLLRALNATIS